ncbi:hypothetical protein ACFLT8_01085 [Chloroflexota bacterium]
MNSASGNNIRKASVCIFIVFALLSILYTVPTYAQAPPPIPHPFYGSVTINAEAAQVGTVVTAKVNGVECGRYIVKVTGQYGDPSIADYLAVGGAIHAGETISFYVNGVDTNLTATFAPGDLPAKLDLSVATATPSVSTDAVTSVTIDSSNLQGSLISLGSASSVTVSFEWGTTTEYGNETNPEMMSSTGLFGAHLSGLAPVTTYHYRTKVVGQGTGYGIDRSFVTLGTGVGGNGQASVADKINTQGTMTQSATVTSADGMCRLNIGKNVRVMNKDGSPLSQINITEMSESPAPPEDVSIINLTYDLEPDGATFDPPVIIEFSYHPSGIPDGVDEDNLFIAYYDKESTKWIEVEGIVNTLVKTITASVSHFTTFAILGHETVAPPTVDSGDFTISSLTISPAIVAPGEILTIGALVTNNGNQPGKYKVMLKITDQVEAISSVTVDVDVAKKIIFNINKNVAGTYSVDVNGLTGSFAVEEVLTAQTSAPTSESQVPPVITPDKMPINWPVILGIIAAIVVVALLIFSLVRRSSY